MSRPLRAALALLVPLAALAGCGNLEVSVAVLNPEIVEAEAQRRVIHDVLPTVLAQTPKTIALQVDELRERHREAREDVRKAYRRIAARESGPPKIALDAAARSMENFSQWDGEYDEIARMISALVRQVQELEHRIGSADDPRVAARLREAQAQLLFELVERTRLVRRRFKAAVAETLASARRDVERAADAEGELQELARTEAEAEIRAAGFGGSLIADGSIVGDPYAFAVASADPEQWQERFNSARGRGYFGNVDIALKMTEKGDFTIKGLSFDPSDVVRMASRVTSQALVLASRMSGVPVPAPEAGAGGEADASPAGAALARAGARLAGVEQEVAAKELARRNAAEALARIAQAILDEQAGLDDASPARRAESIRAIEAVYDAHKARLVGGGNP